LNSAETISKAAKAASTLSIVRPPLGWGRSLGYLQKIRPFRSYS